MLSQLNLRKNMAIILPIKNGSFDVASILKETPEQKIQRLINQIADAIKFDRVTPVDYRSWKFQTRYWVKFFDPALYPLKQQLIKTVREAQKKLPIGEDIRVAEDKRLKSRCC
jgi:hypothetical protein